MAYYLRTVHPANIHDVRTRTYHIYACDVCGEESTYDNNPNFQFKERPCKICKSMGVHDKLNTLIKERDVILKQITEFNLKLLDIETEIREIESKVPTK